MLFLILNALGAAAKAANKHENWKNQNIVICRNCKSENPKGANFCGKCRSHDIAGRLEARKESVVLYKKKQEESLKQIHLNRRMKLAKDYYNDFSKYRVCTSCNVTQNENECFCIKCGSENTVVPTYMLLEWMKSEFPDLIHSYDDIEKVKRFDNPYDVTFGKVVVKGAEVATKASFKIAGAGLKSIFKEIDRKYFK